MAKEIDVRALLVAYVQKQPDGEMLDYLRVEQETGIEMQTQANKSHLRMACKTVRGLGGFKTERGKGVRLTSAENGADFCEEAVADLGRKAQKTEKFNSSVLKKHGDEMTEKDKQRVISSVSFLNTVKLASTMKAPPKMLPPALSRDDKKD